MKIHTYSGDLPNHLDLGEVVAIDTETLGLKPMRDRLCLVQICDGSDAVHLVRLHEGLYDAPNLKKMLADKRVKLFHYARFDIAVLAQYLNIMVENIYCTKIVSKLVRTYTDRHGLSALCDELLGIELSKQQQSSDWAIDTLSEAQKHYAASDVLYLHRLKEKLDIMLVREKRQHLASAAFKFLPTRARLDLMGWTDTDIFSH